MPSANMLPVANQQRWQRRFVFFVLAWLANSGVNAGDWPHWRGPQRNDVVSATSGWSGDTWLRSQLWQVAVGEGGASPLLVENRVYLTGWAEGRDTVYCLDADTGKELWRQAYTAPRYGRHAVGDQSLYSGSNATPEFDSATGLLFTLSCDGDLQAWDTRRQGVRVWGFNLYDRYQARQRPEVAVRKKTRRDYGYVSSPLVVGQQLIVEVGGRSGNLVSFETTTGRERWTSQNHDEAGHTGGPVPITVEGVACVAVLTLRNLVVTRIDGEHAGQTVAEHPWTTDFANNIATPAVSGDSVIISSAYNQFAMCRLGISLQGAQVIWKNDEVATGVCSPVIHQGYVYWAWRGVHCLDYETGKERWQGGKIGAAGSCIMAADGRLIVYGNKGELSLVESAQRSPDKFRQLVRQQIFTKTDAWPHIILWEGHLLCRDRSGNVQCWQTSSESARQP